MTNLLLAASSAIVIALLLALNYAAIQDAYSGSIPPDFLLQDAKHVLFVDVHRQAYGAHNPPNESSYSGIRPVASYSHQKIGVTNIIPTTIQLVEPHGEDSVRITFANKQDGMAKFEHARTVYKGDIFIEACYTWPEHSSLQKMTILKLAGIGDDGAVFHHFEGKTDKKIFQCKYPAAIQDSFGIDWDSKAFEAPDPIPYCYDGYERTDLELTYCSLTNPPGTFHEYYGLDAPLSRHDVAKELLPEPGFHNYSPQEILYAEQAERVIAGLISFEGHLNALNAAIAVDLAMTQIASDSLPPDSAPEITPAMIDSLGDGAASDIAAILIEDGSPASMEAALAVIQEDSYVKFDAGSVRQALIQGDAAKLAGLASSVRKIIGEDLAPYGYDEDGRSLNYADYHKAAEANAGLTAKFYDYAALDLGLMHNTGDPTALVLYLPALLHNDDPLHAYAGELEKAIDLIPPKKA